MKKAVEYTSRANEVMAKAHHECFTSMQKLLVDAYADKASFNKARRRARPRSEEPEAAGAQSDDDSAADDDDPETSDGRDCPLDEIPLEREDPEDEVPESPPEDSYHSSPAPSHGNDEAEDRDIMHDVDNAHCLLPRMPWYALMQQLFLFFFPRTIFCDFVSLTHPQTPSQLRTHFVDDNPNQM